MWLRIFDFLLGAFVLVFQTLVVSAFQSTYQRPAMGYHTNVQYVR